MKKTTFILLLMAIFVAISCGSSEMNKNIKKRLVEYKVHTFEYDSLTIPNFFSAVIKNHLDDFYKIDSISYNEFCEENDLVSTDSNNILNFFSIKLLHDLFTSQTASDCSKGEILNIPYFWHWTSPNPRYEIYLVETNKLLCQTKPPKEFSKYNSYADVDRTPYLFLSDLFQERPKYYSISCDTFSTFGWCSEREMAFVALTKLLNYEGKIVVSGNHSWSELIIKMKSTNREFQSYKVIVDNTFDSFDWRKIKQEEIENWKVNLGNSKLASWYNVKAKSQTELQKINTHIVDNKTMNRIETEIVEYLRNRINAR